MSHLDPGVHADIAALRRFATAIEAGPERAWRSAAGELATRLQPEAPRAIGTSEHHPRLAKIGSDQQANIAAYANNLGQVADALAALRDFATQLHARYRDTDDSQAKTAGDLETSLTQAKRAAPGDGHGTP